MSCQPSRLLQRCAVVCSAAGLLLLAVPSSATSLGELPKQVTRTLERFDLQPGGLSVRVESVDTGEVILDFQSDIRRNPASTMKLVTTYAALSTLNPGYVWHTDVILDGELVDGVLQGDLQIRGGGDPYLVQETLWQMLSELRRRGLQKIDGDLVFGVSTGAIATDTPDRDLIQVGHAAATCLARAIARAIHAATPAPGDPYPTWQQQFGG